MIWVNSLDGIEGVGLKGAKYVEAEYNAESLVEGIKEHNRVSRARESYWEQRTLKPHVVACLSLMGIRFSSKGIVVLRRDCNYEIIASL